MLQINSLQYQHDKDNILTFPDWTVEKGECWLVNGESGSGKTTLLHLITGLLRTRVGEVIVGDTHLNTLSGARLDQFRGKNIGLVFQRAHMIKSLRVLENLLLAQSLAGEMEDATYARDILDKLGIADKAQSYPAALSEGQLQRLSIARSVINRPGLLIADEPTSSLDDVNAGLVLELLMHQAEQNGATLIIATHDSRLSKRIDRLYNIQG